MLSQVRTMLRGKVSSKSASLQPNKRLKTDNTQSGLLDLSAANKPNNVSYYFSSLHQQNSPKAIASQVLQLQAKLNDELRALNFINPPVEYVYNPVEYAFEPNEMYVRKYCTTTKKLLFVGINPGPFGMCQTGVPFGDPKWVREWLNIEGVVGKPSNECPTRQVVGLSSQRREVSGDKLWGLFSKVCGTPEAFFKHSFVVNFCPLAFMKRDGLNVTPGEIKNVQDRKALESECGKWYIDLIQLLEPETIIPIGRYMEGITNKLLTNSGIEKRVIYMPHPSPRAKNNHDWPEKAENFLKQHDLMSYFTDSL